MAGYREEVASLREELSRRQSHIDNSMNTKADLDRVASELKESLLRAQADLREQTSALQRLEVENARLAGELENSRGLLLLKEGDLRSTLTSLAEVQRQASDEKNLLRNENRCVRVCI